LLTYASSARVTRAKLAIESGFLCWNKVYKYITYQNGRSDSWVAQICNPRLLSFNLCLLVYL